MQTPQPLAVFLQIESPFCFSFVVMMKGHLSRPLFVSVLGRASSISCSGLCLIASLVFLDPLVGQNENHPGFEVYKQNCVVCHGKYLEGRTAGPLVKDIWLQGNDESSIRSTVTNGIPGTLMPAWESMLSEEDLRNVAAYVFRKQQEPAFKRDPIPELVETELATLQLESVVDSGLITPWAIEFIDAETAIITERPGRLRWLKNGKLDPKPIEWLHPTYEFGDGGLMDVALDPKYDENGWVYLAYSEPLGNPLDPLTPSMTKVIRGKIDGYQWTNEETLFQVPHEDFVSTIFRFGLRFAFDEHGILYFSVGDRGLPPHAQDLSLTSGKIYRMHANGSVPPDNPFVGKKGIHPATYAYGSRNAQGLAFNPKTGDLWASEHGARGGDELNIIQPGANYGWPEVTHGVNYDGTIISEFSEKPGMESPILHWTPSIAVCPIEFVTSPRFSIWENDLLVGALKFEEIRRLVLDGRKVVSEEILVKGLGRVRDLKQNPDGSLYAVLNDPDIILRITPHAFTSDQVSLFDGTTFDGWEGPLESFRIEDGAIVGGTLEKPIPKNQFLSTKKRYSDFQLKAKFKLVGEHVNAGIQFRTERIPDHHEVIGYQADMGGRRNQFWGALYDESRRRKVLQGPKSEDILPFIKLRDWNDYTIQAEGNRIRLWINGYKTVDYLEEDDSIEESGIIALQIHSGGPSEAWYRDIVIQEL